MPDLLTNVGKIGQPPSGGFDSNANVRSNPIAPTDSQIQNIVDPSKVVRADGRTEADDNRFAYNAESNYGNFLQKLQEMPQLAQLLSKILIFDAQMTITSGLGEDFARQIAQFMDMMKMDPEQLLNYMKDQLSDAGKFGGVFFQTLREVLNGTPSLELRTGILEFLKQYGDMASSDHLLNNILAELDRIIPLMFHDDGETLKFLKEQILVPSNKQREPNQEGGQKLLDDLDARIKENGRILKEEIIPFFSKYITRTRDLGPIRDLMTLLTLNTARYLNGGKENVLQSFEKLFQFSDFRNRLGEIKGENLELILERMLSDQKQAEGKPLTEELLNLIRTGLKGEGGYETKQAFVNVLNAMLLNESVYMPLIHLMLPVNLNGNTMFSEIWIDPDAEDEKQKKSGGGERNIRILVKFDIENLGFFDVVMNYQAGKLNMMVAYPPKLQALEKTIRNGIGQIVADNGMELQSMALEQGQKPLSLMAVFPKITEGRNSVNVRI